MLRSPEPSRPTPTDLLRLRIGWWLDDRKTALLGMLAGFFTGGFGVLVVAPTAAGAVTGAAAAAGAAYGYRWGRGVDVPRAVRRMDADKDVLRPG